jgi:ketosteroid isomerase-like protein
MITDIERRQWLHFSFWTLALITLAVLMLTSGCKKQSQTVDPKASEAEVRAADASWSRAAKAHDMTAVFSYYASDAVVLPANAEMSTDKLGMQKAWSEMLTKDTDLEWTPMWVEAAKSGDIVYVVGSYTMTTRATKGKAARTEHGKYMSVWKKQADGTWKAEANTWNSDAAAASRRS